VNTLSNTDIMERAPSAFAEKSHKRTSESYVYIDTTDILDGIRDGGWECISAREPKGRGTEDLGTHCLSFARREDIKGLPDKFLGVGGLAKEGFPVQVLYNSHDWSSSFLQVLGYLRGVCSNGLITGEQFGAVRTRHTGEAARSVIEASQLLSERTADLSEVVESWKGLKLSQSICNRLGIRAGQLRFGLDEPTTSFTLASQQLPVTVGGLLKVRRAEDAGKSLWAVFNRIQENAVRGGVPTRKINQQDRDRGVHRRAKATRSVTGIDALRVFNRGLWDAADEVAETGTLLLP